MNRSAARPVLQDVCVVTGRGDRPGRTVVVMVGILLAILGFAALYVLNRPPATAVVESGGATPPAPAPTPAEPGGAPTTVAAEEPAHAGALERTLFDGWTPAPAAVLLLTGEQHGQLEPCGCTAGQIGGLSRRIDLVRMLREDKHWPLASFDIGGSLRDERARRPQETIKFKTTRAAQRLMDYDAQGIGTEELRLGADKVFELFTEEQGAGDTRPNFVCANLTLFEERTDGYSIGTPDQFRIVEVGGLKVAVTAVVGADSWSKVFPAGASIDSTLFAFEPADAALKRVVPLMQEQQPDVLILLSHTSADASRELAAQFPVFDAVVTAGGPEDGRREPGLVNETLILEVGQRGKAAGVLGIFPGSDPKLKYELVELNGRQFQHAPQMHELFEQYVQQLNDQHPELQESLGPHPSGAAFVGADACAECHQDAFDIWKGSKHSHGFESLTTGRPDPEDDDIFVVRTRDPECITCHATGWDPQRFARYDGGFVDIESTPHLAGSQCENCHGPGSAHVELEQALQQAGGEASEEAKSARTALHLEVELARTNLCVKCHDLDNSPKFDSEERPFDKWWAEIAH